MKPINQRVPVFMLGFFLLLQAHAADIVPNDIQMPGTQPLEVPERLKADDCKGCHGEYDSSVEPLHNWAGSMMAHATRDPLFWATMAIAEQTFDGSGDLCIRCHTPSGWLAGRSTPTDGSMLIPEDADGINCHFCHTMTNPDNSEHTGVQNVPFVANDGGNPPAGYYGSGQYSVLENDIRLGPYAPGDIAPPHEFDQSQYHRSVDFCGTCHDVSNPLVGDLAPNNGAQIPLQAGHFSGTLGTAVETKAAFNNFPYQYGVVERTYSEYKAGQLSSTPVSAYEQLPNDLKAGRIQQVYQASLAAGTNGNYADGTTRYFSCQSCHMMPVTGQGCNEQPPVRNDLPLHDLTGGNYWMPDAIRYLDTQQLLRVGDPLTDFQKLAMDDGVVRAMNTLEAAATLSVNQNTVRLTNLTGHKLISGYPEGRRMWLNIRWYDSSGALLREDGEYGDLTVDMGGTPTVVRSLLDLDGANTKIYEAHGSITQAWAARLLTLGVPASTPLAYDRQSNAVIKTLGQLSVEPADSYQESFHFVLNNKVVKDNRIPPYGMRYDEARVRNALPVPENQYGDPGPGGEYQYWDEVALNPPAGAASASIRLMYQPTSWEYVQFLYLSNNRQNAFLANEGDNLLDAWLNTGMAEPHVMASATWSAPSLAPTITGIWPGSAAPGDVISLFVFGSNFDPVNTQVSINGVAQPLVQVVSPEMLIVRVNVTSSIFGPVTVTTPQGSAVSSTLFGSPLQGLQITGVWPGEISAGDTVSVFVFGSGFDAAQTTVFMNGIQQFLVAVISPDMLIVRTTGNVNLSGPLSVSTPAGTAVYDSFIVVP